MAQLDQFIKLLHQRKSEAIQATGGQPITLVGGGGAKVLTGKPVSTAKILALVKEIAGPEHSGQLTSGGQAEFSYDSPNGTVQVEFRSEDGESSVTIRPTGVVTGAPATASSGAATATPSGPGPAQAELDEMLKRLVDEGGSDLHLRVGQPPIIRHDGVLKRRDAPLISAAFMDAMHAAVMPPDDKARLDETGDADYAYELPGIARFRGNAAQDRGGPIAVFRVIPSKIPSCEHLMISPEVQKLCFLNKGLVVVTGPTGSGKSTTLAAMVNLINRERQDHILTIEDPIEFVHEGKGCLVTHRQVGLHTKSFKAGLRAALREDPDIILIGELRDLETVAIAIETAETGHLVFGTLHTTTAVSTVSRIIDQFPADEQAQIRVMLSESLRGVVSQTLCKKKGGGRIAAREILLASSAISNLIREGKTFQIPSIMQTSRNLGMVTLNDALLELMDQDLIEPREAYVRSVDKASMEKPLQTRGHDMATLLAQ